MKKVKVIEPYYDKQKKEYPELDSEFDVEEKRAAFLEKAGVVKVVDTPQKTQTKDTKKD